MIPEVKHGNAAGIMGGNAVCGSLAGTVVADDNRVTCPACLAIMKRGKP